MARETEMRYWRSDLETRSAGTTRRIGGLGVPYGQRSNFLPGGFYEVVENRALAKTLGDKINVVSRMEHHPEWLLGDVESGTLRLTNEERGLYYEVDLPNTTAGNDCHELVRTGRIRHSSMGFQAFQSEFRREGATVVRHLISVRLIEVSPTAQPAYADTTTALRSLASQVNEDPEDVLTLAAQGELRSLFSDRHPVVIDVGATEHRSDDAGRRELDLRRRLNEERGKRLDVDRSNDPGERLLALWRRRNQWHAPATEDRPQYRFVS